MPTENIATNESVNARISEYDRMVKSLDVFNVPYDVRCWILAAYNAQDWDFMSSDGCSGPGPSDRLTIWDKLISPVYWPSRWFPVCVAHDYYCIQSSRLWKQGYYRSSYALRWKADKMFYKANRAYGLTRFRSAVRFLGVRIGGRAVTRWLRVRWHR